MAAMYNDTSVGFGGEVKEVDNTALKRVGKTRAQLLEEWRKENEAAYRTAQRAICNCAPSRAQLLLVDQYEGRAPIA